MLMDCRLEDIQCGKYQLVFASAGNILVKPFFSPMKNTANKLWRVKRRVLLFVIQSIVYDHLEEKSSNR